MTGGGADGPAGLLWVEKYRPSELDDVALPDETRGVLGSYLEAGEVPHLLLLGPPGSGKTTVARIITGSLDCRVLSLNASSERGIDVIRNKIGGFITADFGPRWNVVFLDEGDALTADAQTALRNQIENYSERSRFIISGNYGYRIIDALHSRCQTVTLGRPPLKERYRVLARVLEAEGVEAEQQVILGYAERFPDMRKMLMTAQRAWLSNGRQGLPAAGKAAASRGADVLRLLEQKDWRGLRQLAGGSGFDHQQALRDLFWAAPDDHPQAGIIRQLAGRGVHESGFTPDPVILFLGVCAEIMEAL